ncbi:epithelial membrane protein 2-like isoform X2 [Syngnathus typhle]|uniref:epithelial membrane protein 2-like isoform X2 n=1 Tax=Syngnathus typhle TaxID=161592 RepID=UPI002A69EDAA|nr:epithelial membrane protein 2-like isoform X2 [Syngnathus typhle]
MFVLCQAESENTVRDRQTAIKHTAIMLILLAAIFVLHIIAIILLLVATIDNAWWVTETVSTDVWFRWVLVNGEWNATDLPTGSHYPQDYLQAVQATSVLACIFSILGIFVFVAQLFTLNKGQRFTISGVFQGLACLCIMIAASIYTDRFHLDESIGSYGHSYILAWIAFALTFISTIIYFVLRKKTA